MSLISSIHVNLQLKIRQSPIHLPHTYCYLCFDNGKLVAKLYNKGDDFNFPIVNFPILSSNIPSAPVYRVLVSQLVRYARACYKYLDFVDREKLLTN